MLLKLGDPTRTGVSMLYGRKPEEENWILNGEYGNGKLLQFRSQEAKSAIRQISYLEIFWRHIAFFINLSYIPFKMPVHKWNKELITTY